MHFALAENTGAGCGIVQEGRGIRSLALAAQMGKTQENSLQAPKPSPPQPVPALLNVHF